MRLLCAYFLLIGVYFLAIVGPSASCLRVVMARVMLDGRHGVFLVAIDGTRARGRKVKVKVNRVPTQAYGAATAVAGPWWADLAQ